MPSEVVEPDGWGMTKLVAVLGTSDVRTVDKLDVDSRFCNMFKKICST